MSIIYGNVKPTFMEIYPDWKYITKTSPKKTVLRAGTPLGANGRVANSSAALGLVVEDTGESDNPISIVVGGLVDYAKVQASYGNLSAAAISALTGIRLIGSNGSAVVPSPLPSVSSADNGKVLTVSSGVWSAQQPSGGAPCVVLTYDDDEDVSVSCSHTSTALAAICSQYGASDPEFGGVVCAIPAVISGAFSAAGSLWLYIAGFGETYLSSAALRAIVYTDGFAATLVNIEYNSDSWSGSAYDIPLGTQPETGG